MKDKKDLIIGVIYSKFDMKIGPTAVAWVPPELSLNITDLISMKSINIMAGEEDMVPSSLAIIPFPTQKLKGLIKSIKIKDITTRGGAIICSLTLLFKKGNELLFYKYLNTFENLFNEASVKIVELEEKNANKQQLEEELNRFYSTFGATLLNYLMKVKAKDERSEKIEKSPILLYNLIHKDLDKVINALILGEPVIVIGDQALVKLIINTLTIFYYDQIPQINYWTTEYVSGDLIGCPTAIKDLFKTGVKIDLKTGKVSGGKSNKFCKNLINYAKQLDSSHAEEFIKKKVKKIFSTLNQILEMIKQKKGSSTQIESLIKNIDFDEIELIEIYLKSKNPDLTIEISKIISMCRKKMSKILSGFEKQKW